MISTLVLALTRRLKSKGALDPLYFIFSWIYLTYGQVVAKQHILFEIGYPAHPYIIRKRQDVVNAICYYYPGILKHELEYLHRKIHDIKEDDETNPETSNRYERDFNIGKGDN